MTARAANTAEVIDFSQQPRARAHLRECPSGAWIVHDEADRRGGRFADRRSALKFAKREFGANTHIIAHPPLEPASTRRLSSVRQRRLSSK